jgi:signal transduction histidine kinase
MFTRPNTLNRNTTPNTNPTNASVFSCLLYLYLFISNLALSVTDYGTMSRAVAFADSGGMGLNAPDDQPRETMRLSDSQEVLDRFSQIEGQFSQIKEGLAHLQRLSTLGTMTATVVHEFNNILTPIISYAQLAMGRPDDAALSDKAHRKALEGAERASQLCASLLGYARDDDPIGRAPLREAVHSAINCLGRGLEKDGIRVELDLPEIDLAISPTSLEQVLVNLVLNARKAMAERGGSLTIRGWSQGSMVHLDLTDTGRGVPPDVADRLFEPFVTCDPGSSAGQQKGTGLGLSVCRDLITDAAGQVSFESTPGQGTTFHLLIPKAEPLRRSA